MQAGCEGLLCHKASNCREQEHVKIYAAVSNATSISVEKEHVFGGALPLKCCYSMGFLYAVQHPCVN